MKKVLNLLLIGISILCIASCRVYIEPTPPTRPTRPSRSTRPPTPRYDNQTVVRLSRQFGVQLTQTDNLDLYSACSGWLGVKYRYGGNTKNGVDCSGFVGNIYRQVYRLRLERNTANILQRNCIAVNRNSLREGDLVFFRTSGSRQPRVPDHVGIYLKNGRFVHASASSGVMVSNLSEPYFVRSWISGGRVKR